MLNNYYTVKETAKFLNDKISGYLIRDIYTQEKNKLLIEVFNENSDDTKLLEYSIEKGFNYLLLKNNFSKARKNFAGLFQETYEQTIENISLYNEDRVICFKLKNDTELVFTFFSNKANCFLCTGNTIINSFKDKDEFMQKELSAIIPLRRQVRHENTNAITIGNFLKNNYRRYGDLYSEEVLFRNKLQKNDPITDKNLSDIKKSFDEIDIELNNPEFIIYSGDKSFYLSLIKPDLLKSFETKEFDNINDLTSEYIRLKFKIDKTDVLRQSKLNEISGKIVHIEKKITGIQTQLEHCEDSESIRKLGDIILQNIYRINKGDKVFEYDTGVGNNVIVKLKENLTPSENAKFYFDKYKKQKGSVELLKAKTDIFIKEKTKLESELKRINEMTEYKSLIKEEKKSTELKNDETSRFRKFKLNDKYEVWVGRDSASNDLLTTKYAAQNDLWFHVRGASGSHTVLKAGNKKEEVEKESIHRAASIAAYYSKARNASSVPVAYCEKKYVKKKKGFKQGTVTMEREKVIFVKPGLPE